MTRQGCVLIPRTLRGLLDDSPVRLLRASLQTEGGVTMCAGASEAPEPWRVGLGGLQIAALQTCAPHLRRLLRVTGEAAPRTGLCFCRKCPACSPLPWLESPSSHLVAGRFYLFGFKSFPASTCPCRGDMLVTPTANTARGGQFLPRSESSSYTLPAPAGPWTAPPPPPTASLSPWGRSFWLPPPAPQPAYWAWLPPDTAPKT